jgi:tRNA pseudouridine55 synthase
VAGAEALDGVVVVDKPAGMTSHDVVAVVRRALGGRRGGPKVGHAGTLDLDATGVLVVCLGRATRLAPYLQASQKVYAARLRLGVTTTTLDASGAVTGERDASAVDEGSLRAGLAAFVGEIEQIPPMVSAVKVGGERLYAKARRGEQIERAPRRVRILGIALEGFSPGPRAEAAIVVTCSSGTYIRALAADVGERLGVGGCLAGLRRLRSGRFTVDEALGLEQVTALAAAARLPEVLIDLGAAVGDYPNLALDAAAAADLRHGRPLPATGQAGPVAARDPGGRLIGLVADRDGAARPLVVFAPAQAAVRPESGR